MEKTQSNATTASGLTPRQRIAHIVKWLKGYAKSAKIDTFVVGISGGIDSSVVSAYPTTQDLEQSQFNAGYLVDGTLPRKRHTHEHGFDVGVLCI